MDRDPLDVADLAVDEEAVCALLSKHMGYGVTEGMSHMRRDAEPGL